MDTNNNNEMVEATNDEKVKIEEWMKNNPPKFAVNSSVSKNGRVAMVIGICACMTKDAKFYYKYNVAFAEWCDESDMLGE